MLIVSKRCPAEPALLNTTMHIDTTKKRLKPFKLIACTVNVNVCEFSFRAVRVRVRVHYRVSIVGLSNDGRREGGKAAICPPSDAFFT